MLVFDAYSGRDLQNFLAMITQVEDAGVTDIRFVRQGIYNYIHQRRKVARVGKNTTGRSRRKIADQRCPSCGQPAGRIRVDGENIIACRACRWSALSEVR